MPKANWGKKAPSAKDIDGWDRNSQRKLYSGPEPKNGAYRFDITYLKQIAERGTKPHLRVGLALSPRPGFKETKYEGFFVMDFLYIVPGAEFRYVPFLDALGVSGRDLLERTVLDDDGNVQKIGKWVRKNAAPVIASIRDGEDDKGNVRKEVNGYAPYVESDDVDSDDEDDDEDEYDEEDQDDEDEHEEDSDAWDDEDEDEEEDEPESPRRSKKAAKPAKKSAKRRR